MTDDPLLAALIGEYGTTLERLQRSFVGPPDLDWLPFAYRNRSCSEGSRTRFGYD
jgi:hypothetical protein